MTVSIRETTIQSAKDADVVQIFVSDAERGDLSASFVLEFQVRLPKGEKAVILQQMQRDALKIAQDHLSAVRQDVTATASKGVDW